MTKRTYEHLDLTGSDEPTITCRTVHIPVVDLTKEGGGEDEALQESVETGAGAERGVEQPSRGQFDATVTYRENDAKVMPAEEFLAEVRKASIRESSKRVKASICESSKRILDPLLLYQKSWHEDRRAAAWRRLEKKGSVVVVDVDADVAISGEVSSATTLSQAQMVELRNLYKSDTSIFSRPTAESASLIHEEKRSAAQGII